MQFRLQPRDWFLLLLLTAAAIALHGYHFGVQDQFVYVPAIRYQLDPALYPGSTELFLAQARWMLFDELVASFIRISRLPLDWAIFLCHALSLYLLLLGCLKVARRCFVDTSAQWAAVTSVAVMLLLMPAATMIFLADSYLVPRNLATGLLLLSLSSLLDRRPHALLWFTCAFAIHPTFALLGGVHLLFQAMPVRFRLPVFLAATLPLLAAGAEHSAWREVLESRWFIFPLRWPWFAWFGVVVPLGLLAWWSQMEKPPAATPVLGRVCRRLFWSGVVGTAGGVLINVVPALERLIPTEPMRTLHLLNLLAVLLGGGLLGGYWLHRRPLRWAVVFLPLCAVMFYNQRQLYAGTAHWEFPGRVPVNPWVEAFDWVRENTPPHARFALDPRYPERPGEDFHSFAALAARPALFNYSKDRAVVANFPALTAAWREQMDDLRGWKGFRREDFLRLRQKYGVTWVVVEQPAVAGLSCPYSNAAVMVCRIPEGAAQTPRSPP